MNRKPCEFVVVRDKNTLRKLEKSKKLAGSMLSECNTAIVVFGNSEKAGTWMEDPSSFFTYRERGRGKIAAFHIDIYS